MAPDSRVLFSDCVNEKIQGKYQWNRCIGCWMLTYDKKLAGRFGKRLRRFSKWTKKLQFMWVLTNEKIEF